MTNLKTKLSITVIVIVILFSLVLLLNQQRSRSYVAPDIASSSASTSLFGNVPRSPLLTTAPAKVFIGGDIMLDRNVKLIIDAKGFDFLFSDIKKMLSGMDINAANLEGPFTTNPSVTVDPKNKTLQFTFDPALAPKLKSVGFTLLGLANNHTENFGTAGLISTRRYLTQAGLSYYGDPENLTEVSTTTDVRGMKIAFVGYHEFFYKNLQNVYGEIDRLRPLVDYIIVTPHWGVEYQATATEYQQTLAHGFIDHGADAVIGGHPHVIEPFELYKGKPIFYSLGNFVFDQNFSYATTHALTLEIDILPASAQFKLKPITIDNSHAETASAAVAQDILDTLASTSDVTADLKSQIESGTITIQR